MCLISSHCHQPAIGQGLVKFASFTVHHIVLISQIFKSWVLDIFSPAYFSDSHNSRKQCYHMLTLIHTFYWGGIWISSLKRLGARIAAGIGGRMQWSLLTAGVPGHLCRTAGTHALSPQSKNHVAAAAGAGWTQLEFGMPKWKRSPRNVKYVF